jgi:hypothetical protein
MGREKTHTHYYYRKKRSAVQVRSVYAGTGDIAELSAALDEMEQLPKADRTPQRKAIVRRFVSCIYPLNDLA